MLITALLVCTLAASLVAGSCLPDGLPIVPNEPTPPPGIPLAVSVEEPSADDFVAAGDTVRVSWSAGNVTGQPGTMSLQAEWRGNLSRQVILDNIAVGPEGNSGEFSWNTEGFDGLYAIYAVLTAGNQTVEARAPGLITVELPPEFVFLQPEQDATFTLGQNPIQPLTISWRGSDASAQVRIGLDPDRDHGSFTGDPNDTGRNEEFIAQDTIEGEDVVDSIAWEGKNLQGRNVEPGTYFLFALVSDGTTDDLVVEASAKITVVESEPNTPPGKVVVTKPDADKNFLTTDSPLEIEVDVNQTVDVLLDIKVDADDNHQNGNEITILSQRLVKPADPPVAFTWDGTNISGTQVDTGIYRIVAFASTGGTTPDSDESTGFVFRRTTAEQPLISMLTPASQSTIDAGQFVSIKWRDNDPNEPSTDPNEPSASIRLVLDEDGDPATTGDQVQILADRRAKDDGVSDTFSWQVPANTLTPGDLYSVIGFIDRDGVAPDDDVSVSPAKFLMRDPTNP